MTEEKAEAGKEAGGMIQSRSKTAGRERSL